MYGQTTKAPAVPSEPEASGVGDEKGGGLDCFAVFPLQQKWRFLHFGERDTILKEVKKLDVFPIIQAGASLEMGKKKVSV